MTNFPKRYYWVDALRGVAALVIVVFHYHHFYLADAFDAASIPDKSEFPYSSLIAPLYSSFAAHAVELFWLISGFVFAHVYLNRSTTAVQFGVARFARLYPLHFATLLYVAGLQIISLNEVGHWQIYGFNDLRHFALQLVFATNWSNLSRGLSFNGPIWSVSVEVFVYVIFFLSLFLMRRHAFSVTVILFLGSWIFFTFRPLDLPLLRIEVFKCSGYFFLGVLLYLLKPSSSSTRMSVLAIIGAGLIALGLILKAQDVTISGFALCAVSVCARLDSIFPRLGQRLSSLGDISYSVYLVHVPLQMTILLLADIFFDGSRAFADSYFTLPIYLLASVILARLVYQKFERPVGSFLRTRLATRS